MVLNTDNDEGRQYVENCYRTTSTLINPIIEWTDTDVWDFLDEHGCKSNPLYYKGFDRIGCIGCPLGGFKSQKREFLIYPNYRKMYVDIFNRMLDARRMLDAKTTWKTGEEVMRWWIGDDPLQITIDDFIKFRDEIEQL